CGLSPGRRPQLPGSCDDHEVDQGPQSGQWPVSLRTPAAPPRSTAAFTTAKIAPWMAAAASTSPQPYSCEVASGASSFPAIAFHTGLKTMPASTPPATPKARLSGLYSSFLNGFSSTG